MDDSQAEIHLLECFHHLQVQGPSHDPRMVVLLSSALFLIGHGGLVYDYKLRRRIFCQLKDDDGPEGKEENNDETKMDDCPSYQSLLHNEVAFPKILSYSRVAYGSGYEWSCE